MRTWISNATLYSRPIPLVSRRQVCAITQTQGVGGKFILAWEIAARSPQRTRRRPLSCVSRTRGGGQPWLVGPGPGTRGALSRRHKEQQAPDSRPRLHFRRLLPGPGLHCQRPRCRGRAETMRRTFVLRTLTEQSGGICWCLSWITSDGGGVLHELRV